MAVFLVAYDLNREVVRPNITKAIHDGWNWAKLSESSYAVEAIDAGSVYEALKPLIDGNDNLYVIPLKKPYVGFGPQEVNDFLDENLTF